MVPPAELLSSVRKLYESRLKVDIIVFLVNTFFFNI